MPERAALAVASRRTEAATPARTSPRGGDLVELRGPARDLPDPPLKERPLDVVGRGLQRRPVGGGRRVPATESPQEIGAGGVEVRVAREGRLGGQPIQQREP